MNTIPEPKWRIGERIWAAHVEFGLDELDCPDCLGYGKWTVKSPAGTKGEVECPRCGGRKSLKIETRLGKVQQLTIGSIRIDTADHRGEVVSYMCAETGVGSGTVYEEGRLFATEEEAQQEADRRAALEMARIMESPRGDEIKEFKRLAQYQLRDAMVQEAEAKERRVRFALDDLRERIGRLHENAGLGLGGPPPRVDVSATTEEAWDVCVELTTKQLQAVQNELMRWDEEDARWLEEWRQEQGCNC